MRDEELTQEELDKLLDELYESGGSRNPVTGSPE